MLHLLLLLIPVTSCYQIPWKFYSSVAKVTSLILENENLFDKLSNHGCWCSKILNNNNNNQGNILGRLQPQSELDKICHSWHQARKCNDKFEGGKCYNYTDSASSYQLVDHEIPSDIEDEKNLKNSIESHRKASYDFNFDSIPSNKNEKNIVNMERYQDSTKKSFFCINLLYDSNDLACLASTCSIDLYFSLMIEEKLVTYDLGQEVECFVETVFDNDDDNNHFNGIFDTEKRCQSNLDENGSDDFDDFDPSSLKIVRF